MYFGILFFIASFLLPCQIHCPIRIIHAIDDDEVHWSNSLKLLKAVQCEDVDLVIRKFGDHRLMKPRDLTLALYTMDLMLKEREVNLTAAERRLKEAMPGIQSKL